MTLHVWIDEAACLAHGDCADIAPQAFAVGDVASVVGAAPDELLWAAARACPAGAILLIDPATGEEVG
jgi:ferredoxin